LQTPPEYQFFNTMLKQIELTQKVGGLVERQLTNTDIPVRLYEALAIRMLHILDGRSQNAPYKSGLQFQRVLKRLDIQHLLDLRERVEKIIETVLWLGLQVRGTGAAPVQYESNRLQDSQPFNASTMIVANPEATVSGRVQVLIPSFGNTVDAKELVWMLF